MRRTTGDVIVAVEIKPSGHLHKMEQPGLLLDEARDDSYGDVAGRRVEGRPRLDLASRVSAKRPDEELSEEPRKQGHALPGALASLPSQDLIDDREEWAVRDDQVIEALTDAPLLLTRLPVELFGGELTERAPCLLGDQTTLRQQGG